MEARIRELRKELKLSQTTFAESINLTQNYLSLVETGNRNLSDRSIIDICRVFNVNEHWLRTGEGEMFVNMNVEDEVAAYLGKISGLPKEDPRYRIVMAMAKIPEQYWPTIREILDILADRKTE